MNSHQALNRKLALWLFAAFLAFYSALTRGHFYLTDEVEVFQQTQSLWERGNLAVAPNMNTVPGTGGRHFAQYGIGQSVLALPLYVAGKELHRLFDRAHAETWMQIFGGSPIGDPDKHFGGEIEIFFVNLFGAFAVAALLAVFFLFNLRLGAAPRWAIAATVLLGITTHVAGFGVEFLQHPAEALFLLLTIYFLFLDSTNPRWRYRLAAGLATGTAIMVRASVLALLPILTVYVLWHAFKSAKSDDLLFGVLKSIQRSMAFLIPVVSAVALTVAVNYIKFGQVSISGSYRNFNSFNNPELVSLYGYLFSPGQSIFIFSPLLLLAPIYFRSFARKYPAETAMILGLTISYALFYGRSSGWHGQWCFGPRYLMAMLPLLMLPVASWLQGVRPRAWLAILPLALIGAFIEVLHVAVNVSYVYYHEGYGRMAPGNSFLFDPQICQIAAHWHALTAFDGRVDMWLVDVGRRFGGWRVVETLTPLCMLFYYSASQVIYYLQLSEAAPGAMVTLTDESPMASAAQAGTLSHPS